MLSHDLIFTVRNVQATAPEIPGVRDEIVEAKAQIVRAMTSVSHEVYSMSILVGGGRVEVVGRRISTPEHG